VEVAPFYLRPAQQMGKSANLQRAQEERRPSGISGGCRLLREGRET
jgi:hypothetical protein